MLPPEQQPYKVEKVGERLTMLEAYRLDLDFWGNGERKLYHIVTRSLANFLIDNVTSVGGNTMVFWCDIGCGPGYFLEGMRETLRKPGFDVVGSPNETSRPGPVLIPSGVDVSPEALQRCRQVFQLDDFIEVNLDTYKRSEGNLVMPWINADVVSFIDTLQYFKNYRRTFNEILEGLQTGTVIVVADGMVRSNLRDYPGTLDNVAAIGSWTDYSTPVTPRDPGDPHSKNRYLKYRVYRKMM